MNIAITTRGFKAPERLKSYVNEKVNRLNRFSNIIMDGEAVISYEKLDQIVELKLKLKHKVIRITEKSDDVFKSVDLAVDNLERQVAKAKDKLKDFSSTKIVHNLEQ
jgi:putative sigma-54 modulation protein